MSAGTINIDQFWTLTLNGPSDIDRLTASGSLGGAGPVTITGAGSSWTSGTISTTLEIASTANIDIGGNTTKNLTGSLTNRGTVTQSGRSLRIGTVTNYGMWYLTYPSDATVIASSTVVPTFTNYGTVERSGTTAGALADIIRQVGFRNHGTINARTGELQISGFQVIGDGAVMHADGGAHFIMSAVNAAPGATVSGASTITGTGIVEWRSNTFALAAGAVVDARSGFLINGVNIAGPGKVSISGPASWERGTVSGNLEVAPTGTLSFTHNASITKLYVTGNLINNGTVLQADANLYVARAGVAGEITNNGLWQLTNVSSKSFMIRGEAAAPGSFVNNGDLEGSAVATITGLHSTLNLRNNGTVAARSGQFWIRSAPTHYASPILTGGTWEARNGSALFFPTTFTENNATLILSGPGSFFAYLGGTDVFTTNSGTFHLAEGADYATAGNLTNTGTLMAGSATSTDVSTLTVNGDLLLGASSVVEIGVGGTPADNRYGMINVTGAATLDGAFQAQQLNDYVPVPGHSYQVMSYTSMTGAFSSTEVDPFYSADVQPNAVYLNGLDPIPIADAGPTDYNVDEGSTVMLDGSNSIDPGGAIATYTWTTGTWFVDNTIEQPTFANTADDGDFGVSLEVCDFGAQCSSDATTVHVLNVAPDVVASLTTLNINEGTATGTIQLAEFTDPGADIHTSSIDWGDGNIEPGATTSPILGGHTYGESGTYQITVTVTDDDGGFDSTTIDVDVANVAPIVTPGTPTLLEGDGITGVVLATVTDPGVETFSATMDWGDSTGIDTTVSLDTSTMEVTGTHGYLDDGSYSGSVCVADDEPQVCSAVTVTVDNARPTMDVTETLVSAMVGDLVTINGTYGDAGVNDTHTADIDWKDGSSDLGVPVSGNAFAFDHTYTTDGSFTVDVCIVDDDGGRSCDTVQMDIDPIPNLAPEVDALGPYDTTEGAAVDIAGTASDPNGDPFATEWTSPSGGAFGDPSSLVTTFTALDNGTYTITLTGTDSPFGAKASDDAIVTVTNVAPSIGSLSVDDLLPEGSTVSLSGAFSDPGVDDTHSATVDWGDPAGTPLPATVTGNSVSASHMYTQDGTYTVELCVTDDDGGADCSSVDITIVNVLPTVTAIADQEIDRGDALGPMVIASFADPGSDTWTATVDWGDGAGEGPASVDALSMTVTGGHVYDTAGTFTATVCVSDEHGQHCDGFAVVVAELSSLPTEKIAPVADAGGPYHGHEGRWIRVDGSDSSDEDGRIVSYHWTASGGRFNHPNAAKPKFKAPDNGTYTLTLEVTDNDGLTSRTTATVIVLNLAPRVNSGRNATIKSGHEYSLRATYTDPGADTHRTTIDWGDGSHTTVDPSQSPVRSNHRYDKPGKYKVRVTVIDDDGGRHSDTHKVTVKNARTDHRKKIRDFIRRLLDKLRKHWRYRGGWAR